MLKERAVIYIWEEFRYWYVMVEYQNAPSQVKSVFNLLRCGVSFIKLLMFWVLQLDEEFTAVRASLQQLCQVYALSDGPV